MCFLKFLCFILLDFSKNLCFFHLLGEKRKKFEERKKIEKEQKNNTEQKKENLIDTVPSFASRAIRASDIMLISSGTIVIRSPVNVMRSASCPLIFSTARLKDFCLLLNDLACRSEMCKILYPSNDSGRVSKDNSTSLT